jgi:predicted nucleic acid-binding protein
VRIGQLAAQQAGARLSELRHAPITSIPVDPYLDDALRLAVDIGYPVCNCLYLALALQRDTQVITADRRFVAAASRPELNGRVRLLTG